MNQITVVEYDVGAGVLTLSGPLENNAEQRKRLADIFGIEAKRAAQQKERKLTVNAKDLSVNPEAVDMWIALTEEPLREIEMEYPYSQLSLALYHHYLRHSEDNVKHTFIIDPSSAERSEPPTRPW